MSLCDEPVLVDQPLTRHTTALLGAHSGKYPDANAVMVRGAERNALIEATLGVRLRLERGDSLALSGDDIVLLSHCHEDHIPALPLLPELQCWVHQSDRSGFDDLESFLDLFGQPPEKRRAFREVVIDQFHYAPRAEALAFADGHEWDLGGVTVRGVHAPGHTAGHCVFVIEPDSVVYLGDVDLSTFGPYYGDEVSSLEDFERTLELVRGLDARWYVSGHHKGVVEGRTRFLELLEGYSSALQRREHRLLKFLSQPRTLDEIAEHRIIYRPGDDVFLADHVERNSARMHLEKLEARGEVEPFRGDDDQPTRWVAA